VRGALPCPSGLPAKVAKRRRFAYYEVAITSHYRHTERDLNVSQTFEPSSSPALTEPSPEANVLVQSHREAVADLLTRGQNANTARAYRSAAKHFARWCEGFGYSALPASPKTLEGYVADLAAAGRKPSTITQRLAAIRKLHETADLESPTGHPRVREAMKAARKTLGTRPEKKAPATVERIAAMLAHVDRSTVSGKRDAALLLFGFASAMRRSELVALQVEDLELTPSGLLVLIRKSKTDQTGEGMLRPVLFGREETCPAKALAVWLEAAGITEGPVFRSVDRSGKVRPSLSAGMVARIVKKYATKVPGLKPSDFAGHSLRSGVATSSSERGASLQAIANLGGWKRIETAAGYVQKQDAWKDHAAKGLL